MRNTESLMKVKVTDITADITGSPSPPWHSCCAVDVNLTAVLMGDVTDLSNSLFKYTVRDG